MSGPTPHMQAIRRSSQAFASSSGHCSLFVSFPHSHSFYDPRTPLRSRAGKRHNRVPGKSATRGPVVTFATLDTETEEEEIQIEGLERDYCTDFVCTSSPAVEQTVRALARDLLRQTTWTSSLFTEKVTYKDPLRSFTGIDKYWRLKYPADCVTNSKILVTKLRMLDRSNAEATWRLRGTLGVLPLDITFTSVFTLDLITGRVMEHRDSWDLSRCSLPARAAFLASRTLWSLKQAAQDTKESSSKLMEKLSSSEEGDQQQGIYRDPTDPTKFFQQEDNTMQDAFLFAAVLALFYVLVNAWQQLAALH